MTDTVNRRRLGGFVAALGGLSILWNVILHRATDFSLEPFFDEMWRIDGAASGDGVARVMENAGTIPPMWLWSQGRLFWLSDDFVVMRTLNLVLIALGIVLMMSLVVRGEFERSNRWIDRIEVMMSAIALMLVLAAGRQIFYVADYFNNYGWEIVMTAVAVWAGGSNAPARSWLWRGPLLVYVGMTVQGSVPFLISFMAIGLLSQRRFTFRGVAIRSLPLAAVSVGVAAQLALVSLLQSEVQDGGLKEYWSGLVFDSGDFWRSLRTFGDSLVNEFLPQWINPMHDVRVGLVLLGVIGLCISASWRPSLARRIVLASLLAIPSTAVASEVTGAPFAVCRVTVAGFIPLAVVLAHEALRLLRWTASKVHDGAALMIVVLLLPLAVVPSLSKTELADNSPSVFARGLLADTRRIDEGLLRMSNLPTRENFTWVVYHPMAHWYVRFGLRGNGSKEKILFEQWGEETLYDRANLARKVRGSRLVVCVIPYENGPEKSARSCPMTRRFTLIDTQRLGRAEFRTFRLNHAT